MTIFVDRDSSADYSLIQGLSLHGVANVFYSVKNKILILNLFYGDLVKNYY